MPSASPPPTPDFDACPTERRITVASAEGQAVHVAWDDGLSACCHGDARRCWSARKPLTAGQSLCMCTALPLSNPCRPIRPANFGRLFDVPSDRRAPEPLAAHRTGRRSRRWTVRTGRSAPRSVWPKTRRFWCACASCRARCRVSTTGASCLAARGSVRPPAAAGCAAVMASGRICTRASILPRGGGRMRAEPRPVCVLPVCMAPQGAPAAASPLFRGQGEARAPLPARPLPMAIPKPEGGLGLRPCRSLCGESRQDWSGD